jgi:hypothetical protein
MEKTTGTQKPIGVLLIAAFYLLGALLLLISLITNPNAVSRTIADAHGLPPAADTFILPGVASVGILIAYGLFTRRRWGYFFTITYLLLFGSVNFWLMSQDLQQPYIGNST